MEYEYRVTNFDAEVTRSELASRKTGEKIAAQLEILLQEHAREGWELQGQYQFSVKVNDDGCFLFPNKGPASFTLYQLVFRRPM
jgi:hypothetical protein